jgi:hypothetical protein
MTREEIYTKVQAVLVDALGVDEEEVKPESAMTWAPRASTSWTSCSAWKRASTSRSRVVS